eukprot:m.115327 g.115327  ORF g.115327 m.115327 type:complete len:607 (-) comp14447_c1_seq1:957-2777(-)
MRDGEYLNAYWRYLFVWRCAPPPLALPSEKKTLMTHARAGIAIYGSIIFWIGSWNLLSESQPYTTRENSRSFELFDDSMFREFFYMITGLGLLILSDTLYGNGGLGGGYFPQSESFTSTIPLLIRAILGLVGSVLIWVGLYDLLDLYSFPDSPLRDSCFLLGGMLTLLFTRGFYAMAYVYPPDDERIIPTPTPSSPWHFHTFTALRAMLSIGGQTLVWLGAWNLLEYTSDSSIWREAFYACAGMLLFILTNSFVPNSYINEEDGDEVDELGPDSSTDTNPQPYLPIMDQIGNLNNDVEDYMPLLAKPIAMTVVEPDPDSNVSVAFYIRTVVAMAAQIMHGAGVWTLLDTYVLPLFFWRDVACCLGGLSLLVISGTLMQNAAITPIMTAMWQPDDDAEDMQFSPPPAQPVPTPLAAGGINRGDSEQEGGPDGDTGPMAVPAHAVRRRYDPDTWSVISTMSTSARQWRSRRRRFIPADEDALETGSLYRRSRRDSMRSRTSGDMPEFYLQSSAAQPSSGTTRPSSRASGDTIPELYAASHPAQPSSPGPSPARRPLARTAPASALARPTRSPGPVRRTAAATHPLLPLDTDDAYTVPVSSRPGSTTAE